MHVQILELLGFRNYATLAFNPAMGLNVLYGTNAQGKSAVLESLYLLATSKSHRTSHDADMIRIGDEATRVNARVIRTASTDIALEVILSRKEKKTVKLNGAKHQKIADLIGQLKAVIFSALDIEMVRGEPDLRRRFLNLEISQVSPQYVFVLARYKRSLEQRNNLLKELRTGIGSSMPLDVWDAQVAEYGSGVIARRRKFCASLSLTAADIYGFLTDSAEQMSLSYKPSLQLEDGTSEADIRDAFVRKLAEKRDIDIARATTTVGPHRDDIGFEISGMDARDFASQGQQRTAALAVKLAEVELMEQEAGESPIVLLDDAGAELDELRRRRVVEKTAGKCQTFITTTRPDELGNELLQAADLFEVKAGTVTPQ